MEGDSVNFEKEQIQNTDSHSLSRIRIAHLAEGISLSEGLLNLASEPVSQLPVATRLLYPGALTFPDSALRDSQDSNYTHHVSLCRRFASHLTTGYRTPLYESPITKPLSLLLRLSIQIRTDQYCRTKTRESLIFYLKFPS